MVDGLYELERMWLQHFFFKIQTNRSAGVFIGCGGPVRDKRTVVGFVGNKYKIRADVRNKEKRDQSCLR